MNRLITACLLPAVLVGCAAAPTMSSTPISTYTTLILNEATSLHQLELALAALQQAPTVVMRPTPVIVTPNPGPAPPVTVTPVVPGAPVPPVVGGGGPIVTPSVRYRRHSHQSDDNPPVSAASLNAAQLSTPRSSCSPDDLRWLLKSEPCLMAAQ
jgi:hypothetical protein